MNNKNRAIMIAWITIIVALVGSTISGYKLISKLINKEDDEIANVTIVGRDDVVNRDEKNNIIVDMDNNIKKNNIETDSLGDKGDGSIINSENKLINNENNKKEPQNTDLVKITDYIPSIKIDLKYATKDNFTKTIIYKNNDAYLRYGTIKKLKIVQEKLNKQGYSILVYDAYRPVWAQKKLWEIYPDPVYVANPNNGYSNHSRGNTIDVSIIKIDGAEVAMPSKFDDFTDLANRDYSDVSEEQRNNALLLENLMIQNGFNAYQQEWWHYSDIDTYEIVQE